MVAIISDIMPSNLGICRIHVAGDFFNLDYMRAWYSVALANPNTLFYAYTKSLRFWHDINEMPTLHNFVLTASYGGRNDWRIDEYDLRFA